jgi:hypothetical protein
MFDPNIAAGVSGIPPTIVHACEFVVIVLKIKSLPVTLIPPLIVDVLGVIPQILFPIFTGAFCMSETTLLGSLFRFFVLLTAAFRVRFGAFLVGLRFPRRLPPAMMDAVLRYWGCNN